jgi:hypothetical protein
VGEQGAHDRLADETVARIAADQRRRQLAGHPFRGTIALASDGNRLLAARSRVGAMTTFALESA